MKTRKVKVGVVYRYEPVLIDRFDPPFNVHKGDLVRVVHLHGCPPPNTMGHCHVEHLDGKFGGLILTDSLQPIKRGRK